MKANEETFQRKYSKILLGGKLHDRHLNYLEEVNIIKRYVSSGSYLDIGCHAGWLLEYVKKATKISFRFY